MTYPIDVTREDLAAWERRQGIEGLAAAAIATGTVRIISGEEA
jgi:hypothetical protein